MFNVTHDQVNEKMRPHPDATGHLGYWQKPKFFIKYSFTGFMGGVFLTHYGGVQNDASPYEEQVHNI